MRHRFIALPLAAVAVLAFASGVVAGGWAQVTVKDAPVDPVAGGKTIIGLRVLQHGVTPVSWPKLTVVATEAKSGAVVRTQAQPKGPEGSYVATIVFPSAGEWSLTFEAAELVMEGSAALSVAPTAPIAPAAPVVKAAPPVTAAEPPVPAGQPGLAGDAQPGAATPASPALDMVPLGLLLFSALVVLAIGGLILRNRGASSRRVSART